MRECCGEKYSPILCREKLRGHDLGSPSNQISNAPTTSTLISIRALKELFCGFRVELKSICGCTCESWLELGRENIWADAVQS